MGWKWALLFGVIVVGCGGLWGGLTWQQQKKEAANAILHQALEVYLAPLSDIKKENEVLYVSYPDVTRYKTAQEKMAKVEELLAMLEKNHGKQMVSRLADGLHARILADRGNAAQAEILHRKQTNGTDGFLQAAGWDEIAIDLENQKKAEQSKQIYSEQSKQGALGYRLWYKLSLARLSIGDTEKSESARIYSEIKSELARLVPINSNVSQMLKDRTDQRLDASNPFLFRIVSGQNRSGEQLRAFETMREFVDNRLANTRS